MSRPPELQAAVDELYAVFAKHQAPTTMCEYCYDHEEVAYFVRTPVREIRGDKARQLMWEAFDHGWTKSEDYRHHLPCILEAMAPPDLEEDMYPIHLAQTLHNFGFPDWPDEERQAVLGYLDVLTPLLDFTPDDEEEWLAGKTALEARKLPPLTKFHSGPKGRALD